MLITEIDAVCNDADVYFPRIDKEIWTPNVLSSTTLS